MKRENKNEKYDVPTPQWLKEVLNRGFNPNKTYKRFDKFLYAYINPFSRKVINIPNIKIFAIEGLPGSGKTSIIEFFSKNGISTVQQILPSEPPCDIDMPQSFYFKSDQLKTEHFLKSKSKVSLSDRYYASTLAYYWSYDKIHMTNKYDKALRWYESSLKNKKLIKPFSVFYIKTPPEISLKRKRRGENNFNLWHNKNFLNYFNNYYNFFYKNIEPQTRVINLSGKISISNLVKIIELRINEAK